MTDETTPQNPPQEPFDINNEMGILTLITGERPSGAPYYAYVSLFPATYDEFLYMQSKGGYDLAKYGTIITHGYGLEPEEHIKRQMEEEYGFDHNYEAKLLDELTKAAD